MSGPVLTVRTESGDDEHSEKIALTLAKKVLEGVKALREERSEAAADLPQSTEATADSPKAESGKPEEMPPTAQEVASEFRSVLAKAGYDPKVIAALLMEQVGAASSESSAEQTARPEASAAEKSVRETAKTAEQTLESEDEVFASTVEDSGEESPLDYKGTSTAARKGEKQVDKPQTERGRSEKPVRAKVESVVKTPKTPKHRERSRSVSPVMGTVPRLRADTQQRKREKKQAKKAAQPESEPEKGKLPAKHSSKRRADRSYADTVRDSVAGGGGGGGGGPPSSSGDSSDGSDSDDSMSDGSSGSTDDTSSVSDIPTSAATWSEDDDAPYDGFRVVHKKKTRKYPKPGSILKVPDLHNFRAPFKSEITEKYTGRDKRPQALERWFLSIRTQLRAAMIHENSQYATTILLSALTENALAWAGREISKDLNDNLLVTPVDLREVASPWPLEKIRVELHARFVDPDDHHQADAEWRTLSQRRADGSYMSVQRLETVLLEIAERRIEVTPTERKVKFVNALRPEITKELHRTHHLRGWDKKTKIRLRHLVKEAMNIEQALNLMEESARQNGSSKATNYEMLQSRKRNGKNSSQNDSSKREDSKSGNHRGSRPSGNREEKKDGDKQDRRPRRSPEEQTIRDQRDRDRKCWDCGGDHMARSCPEREKNQQGKLKKEKEIKEIAANPDIEGGGPYPSPFVVPISLSGQTGFEAMVDTGASHSVMKHSLPFLVGAKVKTYKKPQKIAMSAKGSHVTAFKYVECEMSVGGVTKDWRFILLNIAEDVVLGRDFLREHRVSLEFNPDRFVVHDIEGSTPSGRQPKRKVAHEKAKRRQAEMLERVDAPSPFQSDTLPPHERSSEPKPLKLREFELMSFSSKLITKEQCDVPGWVPPREVIDEFLNDVLTKYKANGTILSKEEIMPCAPYRGALDHDVPYISDDSFVPPAQAYPWSRAQRGPMLEMLEGYERGGQFVPTALHATAPLVPKLKKNGKGRPVNDLRKRNAITRPIPLQPVNADAMINDVAAVPLKMGVDLMKAFEQVAATEDACKKNIVATPVGNFMTWNAFTAEVLEFFARCYMWNLIVSEESIQMCPDEAEILGRRIKNGEISMSPKQVDAILNYVRPTTQKSLRRFLGLVEWHAPFIPNLATAAAPLHDLTGSDPWRWSRTHDLAFERVKQLISKDVKLASIESDTLAPQGTSPVHRSKPPSPDEKVENEAEGNYLFVFTDASIVGTSGVLAVGKNWWSARPVGYCSRKHDTARSRWGAYKQELVGPVNAAEVWKDVLLNQHVVFVTDNDAVSKLGSQNEREEWQAKVAEKLSILDHEVQWIEGQYNVAADALSRQYEDGDPKEPEVMRVFNLLDEEDPDGKTREFRPMDRPQRARRAPAFHNDYVATPRRKQRPADAIFAEREARYEEDLPDLLDGENRLPANAHLDNPEKATHPLSPFLQGEQPFPESTDEVEPAKRRRHRAGRKADKHRAKSKAEKAQQMRAEMAWEQAEDKLDEEWWPRFVAALAEAQSRDPTFGKVLSDVEAHSEYFLSPDKLLWQKDEEWGERLCLPDGTFDGRAFREVYLEHFHTILRHAGERILLHTLRQHVFWPFMARDTKRYCFTCILCQACKTEKAPPRGKLHSIKGPTRAYEQISIDFTGPHPISYDVDGVARNYILTIIDGATGECKLIPCHQTGLTSEKCAQLFLEKVYPSWGCPQRILSDKDVRWVSSFWRSFHKSFGTTLSMSTAYHPQSNGKTERLHAVINPMLRQLVSETQEDWASSLPHVEYAINSARNASGYRPFEPTRVFQPRVSFSRSEPAENNDAEALLEKAKERNAVARDILCRSRIEQTYFANLKRRPDHVPDRTMANGSSKEEAQAYWVRTHKWRKANNRSRALVPPFDGPFRCVRYNAANSTYELALPPRYTSRGISPIFHASQLKPYVPSDDGLFPERRFDSVPWFPLDTVDMTHPLDASNVDRYVDHYWVEEDGTKVCFLHYKARDRSYHEVAAGAQGHTNESQKLQDYVISATKGRHTTWEKLPERTHAQHAQRKKDANKRHNKPPKKLDQPKQSLPAAPAPVHAANPFAVSDSKLARIEGWQEGYSEGRNAARRELNVPATIANTYRAASEAFKQGSPQDEFRAHFDDCTVIFIRPHQEASWERGQADFRRYDEMRRRERDDQRRRREERNEYSSPTAKGKRGRASSTDRAVSPAPSVTSTVGALASATANLSTQVEEMEE
ncbi:hypothetical protein Rt10032_c05g2227 [Rhodotorula toruloides]|uniref:RNA-directed DNA polymerase n=1 Tax=Rhodotorula toruloides TaxID=5286 RepID=A0A511KCU9_RHOTO|nr:hypothetical protein Rt10032_c05g2227 [Rhodotorula toruloides]